MTIGGKNTYSAINTLKIAFKVKYTISNNHPSLPIQLSLKIRKVISISKADKLSIEAILSSGNSIDRHVAPEQDKST